MKYCYKLYDDVKAVPSYLGNKVYNYTPDAVKYVLPYFNSKKIIAAMISYSAPFIETIGVYMGSKWLHEGDEQEGTNSADNVLFFIYCCGLAGLSVSMRLSADEYLKDSLAKSIKLDKSKKLLDDNNFLTGKKFVDKTNELVSMQKVTIGSRVDLFVDSVVSTSVSLPANIISVSLNVGYLACSAYSAYNLYVFFLPTTFAGACGIITSCADSALSKLKIEEEDVSNLLANRTAYIEDRSDEICLIGANQYERNFLSSELQYRQEKSWPIAKMKLQAIFFSKFVAKISVRFFDSILCDEWVKNISINDIKYLDNIVSTLIRDTHCISEVYFKKYPLLKANLDKLKSFDHFYEEWHKHRNNFFQNFGCKRFEILKLQINFGKDTEDLIKIDSPVGLKTGKIYKLLGESGSGKTTFLKTIKGCWPYVEGIIDYPCKKEEICYITPDICIPPNMTLYKIIFYPQDSDSKRIKSRKEDYLEQITKLLEVVGCKKLIGFLETPNKCWSSILSSGEKQKISLISAIVKCPKVLIMDEPVSNLCSKIAKKLLQMLKIELVESHGTTIIYTSHHPINEFVDYTMSIEDQELSLDVAMMGNEKEQG